MDATLTTDPTTTSSTTPARLPERFAQIPLRLLQESPHNPRTHFDQAKLIELGESIQAKGIIEPLVVREFDTAGEALSATGGYEIVAGARRFRAAKLAGLETVPCIVRDYSDDDALEIFVIENLQRDDLSPLEQARGFKQLLTANADRFSVATIAGKVGMSPAWVWDRLKLLDLVPEAQTLLESGRITVGHAIVLARLKPADQERAIDPNIVALWQPDTAVLDLLTDSDEADPYDGYTPNSIKSLEGWVANHVRFDVAHAAQAVPLDFEEVAHRVEQAQQAPGRGKKVISITYNHFTPPEARDEAERTYGPQSWRRADGREDSQTCEHSVLGLVVVGPRQGSAFDVCIARDKCEVHFKAELTAKRQAEKARAKGDTATAKKVEKRQEKSWERQERERREREAIWAPIKPAIFAAAYEQVKTRVTLTPAQAKVFAEQGQFTIDVRVAEEVLGKRWFESLAAAALVSAIADFWGDSFDSFVTQVAVPLGLAVKPLEQARAAHQSTIDAPAAAAPAAKKGKGRK